MTYDEFVKQVNNNFMHETIYKDSEGRSILVIQLLDAYYMLGTLSKRELVGLTKDEAADLWADAHDIEGRMIWTPEQLFKEIERRLKEKNT